MNQAPTRPGLQHIAGDLPSAADVGWYVFSTVRNESLRLAYFLEYYRAMGATRFVIVDNASTDSTSDYLKRQPDVSLFSTAERFSVGKSGTHWLNALLHEFGIGRWSLTVDADEFLVYPHCERLPLGRLAEYLEASSANSLPAFMLDLYSDGPIRGVAYEPGTPLIAAAPFFDATDYTRSELPGSGFSIPVRGGPRRRLFWDGRGRDTNPPYLFKIPFARLSAEMRYGAVAHSLPGAVFSEVTGALMHFKLLGDFPARSQEEVTRGEHFDHASEHIAYWDVLSEQPDLSAFHPASVRYQDSEQLLALGLLHSSPDFDAFASRSIQIDGRARPHVTP